MKSDPLKGLRLYLTLILVAVAFFAYSQYVGWKWMGATKTSPPTDEKGTSSGYRYLRHK